MIKEPFNTRNCMYCGATCAFWSEEEFNATCRATCWACREKEASHDFLEVCPECHALVDWRSGSVLSCACLPKILAWAWVPREGGDLVLVAPTVQEQDHSGCCS